MKEEISILLKFNKQLHDLVDTKLQFDITDNDNKSFFTAFAIGKAFKTYEAVGVLCRSGYGEDAFILTHCCPIKLKTTPSVEIRYSLASK